MRDFNKEIFKHPVIMRAIQTSSFVLCVVLTFLSTSAVGERTAIYRVTMQRNADLCSNLALAYNKSLAKQQDLTNIKAHPAATRSLEKTDFEFEDPGEFSQRGFEAPRLLAGTIARGILLADPFNEGSTPSTLYIAESHMGTNVGTDLRLIPADRADAVLAAVKSGLNVDPNVGKDLTLASFMNARVNGRFLGGYPLSETTASETRTSGHPHNPVSRQSEDVLGTPFVTIPFWYRGRLIFIADEYGVLGSRPPKATVVAYELSRDGPTDVCHLAL